MREANCSIPTDAVDLPPAALDPRVTVVYDLTDLSQLGWCGQCPLSEDTPALMRGTYRYTEGAPEIPTDLCGRWCADEWLTEQLHRQLWTRPRVALTLHLPMEWKPAERVWVALSVADDELAAGPFDTRDDVVQVYRTDTYDDCYPALVDRAWYEQRAAAIAARTAS